MSQKSPQLPGAKTTLSRLFKGKKQAGLPIETHDASSVDQAEPENYFRPVPASEPNQIDTPPQTPKPIKGKFWVSWSKKKKAGASLILVILLLLTLTGVLVAISLVQAQSMKLSFDEAQREAGLAYEALKTQDLVTSKQHLDLAHQKVQQLQNQYAGLSYWRFTPMRWHYQDGQRVMAAAVAGVEAGQIMVDAIEPYGDVIGFTGEGSFKGGTAEERIVKVVETLDKVTPSLDEVQQKLHLVNQELDGISSSRYPFSLPSSVQNKLPFEATTVGEAISQAKGLTHQAENSLNDYRPAIEQLPRVAGSETPKTYLVLFQNDGELRPTGGFMTAYAILKVDKGKIEPVKSDDIYELDDKFRSSLTPPEPIKKYLPAVPVWNLRDMNLSPDFKVSMDEFYTHYQEVAGEPEIDGIIAVDTHFLTELLRVLGPVEVPGYGTFTAETHAACDCPQVVYQLENMITRPTPYHRSDRKGVLGPLMQTILQKAFGAPKQVYPQLFKAGLDSISQKHMLFYFNDPEAQAAAEKINVAGRMQAVETDFLHINDANFGGAKSNMFVVEEVEQDITYEAGVATNKVTITYKNPRRGDNCNLEAGQLCLNGVLPSWTRIYLPKGSQVTETLGFDEGTTNTSEELDKTVVEGFFKLNPQAQAKIVLTYTVPYQPSDAYSLYIQKQPGKSAPAYTVTFNNEQRQEFELLTDEEVVFEM